MEDISPYVYTSISKDDDIRLLVLQPGKFGDAILCSLSTVPFSAKPECETLLYAWGSSNRTHPIWAPGPLYIGKNLYSALQHLRFPDMARTLWLDAICINQDSVPERN
jgi:hypothetical protein